MITAARTPPPSRRRSIRIGGLLAVYDDRVPAPDPGSVAQALWAAEVLESEPPGPVLDLCAGVGHVGLVTVAITGRRLVAVAEDEVAAQFIALNARTAVLDRRVDVRRAPPDPTDAPSFALVLGAAADDVQARACLAAAAPCLAPGRSLVLRLDGEDPADHLVASATRSGAWLDGGRRSRPGRVVQRLVRAADQRVATEPESTR